MYCAKLDNNFKVEQIIILPDAVKGNEQHFMQEILKMTGKFVFDVDKSVWVGGVYDKDTGEFTRPETDE